MSLDTSGTIVALGHEDMCNEWSLPTNTLLWSKYLDL